MQRQEPNHHGVYVNGVETVSVPLSKSLRFQLDITVVCCNDGLWRWGYAHRDACGGGCGAPKKSDQGHATRSEALQAGAVWYRKKWRCRTPEDFNVFCADIARFIESLPVDGAALKEAIKPKPVAKKRETSGKEQRYEQLSLF